jgi:hypothetical protein
MKHKTKYPSSKLIKREDMYSHRLKYRTYIPSERFHYDKFFEDSIQKMNKVRLNRSHSHSYHNQLTGGPRKKGNYVVVDLTKKKIFMSSPVILKYIVKIQAKWKAVYQRKRYLCALEEFRENRESEFETKLASLRVIYPVNKRIDMKAVESRLKRISMKISNIIRPY